MSDGKLADYETFELVDEKQSAKPKRKRREMTAERKAAAVANLAKGRAEPEPVVEEEPKPEPVKAEPAKAETTPQARG